MHRVVLTIIKEIILISSFLSIFVGEVSIIDNQNWIFVHCYVVVGWKQVFIFLTLERLVEGGTIVNIKNVILVAFITYGGFINEQIFECLMCLRTDGVSTFQGVQSKVIALMKTQQTPFLIGIHCMTHKTNLVMQSLSSMPMVSKMEDLFQSIYGYFFSSPKHHLEFTKLVEIVETKGLKVFQNVKTKWINMLAPLKWVGKEFKTLIVKMVANNGFVEATKTNLVNLCDVGTISGIPCILSMLESINALIKFA